MPIPDGSPPDLTFYYNLQPSKSIFTRTLLGTSSLLQTFNAPLFADLALTTKIGKWATTSTIYDLQDGDKNGIYESTALQVYFLPQGTITINNNAQRIKDSQGSFVLPTGTFIYQIICGSGDFLNYSGFLAVVADDVTFTRTVYVYFNKPLGLQ